MQEGQDGKTVEEGAGRGVVGAKGGKGAGCASRRIPSTLKEAFAVASSHVRGNGGRGAGRGRRAALISLPAETRL